MSSNHVRSPTCNLVLRASVHDCLLRPHILNFAVNLRRLSIMSIVKEAVNLLILAYTLYLFASYSNFIESFAIRLEKWPQPASLDIDWISVYCSYIKWLQNYITKWHIKKTCVFKGICLYETIKVAVSARVMSSNIRWRRIFHESIHVLRETWDT